MFNKNNTTNPLVDIINSNFGHQISVIKKESVDKDGNPVPWYTYPALEYINNLDFKDMSVFEYGSGNGSIFWGKKSKKNNKC